MKVHTTYLEGNLTVVEVNDGDVAVAGNGLSSEGFHLILGGHVAGGAFEL